MNLSIELVTNIMFFVLFYYIQKILNIDVIPEILIFYYGFIYVTVHIINYSVFNCREAHVLHHTTSQHLDKTTNYGPDLADHICHTNNNNNFENYNHIIPNVILSFLTTYCIYKPKFLTSLFK